MTPVNIMDEVHAVEKEVMSPYRRIAFLKSKIKVIRDMFPKDAVLDPYFENIIQLLQNKICKINTENFNEDEVDVDEILSGDIEQDRQDDLLDNNQ